MSIDPEFEFLTHMEDLPGIVGEELVTDISFPPELRDDPVRKVTERRRDYSAADKKLEREMLLKAIVGPLDGQDSERYDEFGRVLRKFTVAPVTREIPTERGAIPNARPKGSEPRELTSEDRKKQLRELVEQELAATPYQQETLESLVEAMNSFIENQIG